VDFIMHEKSLMTGLMKKIADLAAAENASKVTRVSVWLGALSHMSESHFTEHFLESSRGHIAEGAQLQIECSEDHQHPNAMDILLKEIDVEQ